MYNVALAIQRHALNMCPKKTARMPLVFCSLSGALVLQAPLGMITQPRQLAICYPDISRTCVG